MSAHRYLITPRTELALALARRVHGTSREIELELHVNVTRVIQHRMVAYMMWLGAQMRCQSIKAQQSFN